MNSYQTIKSVFILSGASLVAAGGYNAQAQEGDRRYETGCDGGRSGDLDTGETECRQFFFKDSTSEISAGVATSSKAGFDGNEWLFSEGLRIRYLDAEVTAGRGRLVFENDELVEFELSGSPAMLTVYIAERDLEVNGSAGFIGYRTVDEIFRLDGDVDFIIGDNQDHITSCSLLFNLRDNSYDAGTDNCGIAMEGTVPDSASGNDGPDTQ